MAGDEEDLKEFDDPPPNVRRTATFWLWHLCCWIFYGFVTIIYIPWALAMHAVVLAASISLPFLCCWAGGRKVLLYFYVFVVMLPGKFLWFNLFRRNRRRGRVYDFEMEKPRALPLQKRRRLSVSEAARPQVAAPLMTKLPPEIRLLIYKHVIVGDSDWFYVVDGEVYACNAKKDKRVFKNRAYPFMLSDVGTEDDPVPQNRIRFHRTPIIIRTDHRLTATLALLRTCRQVYMEAIGLCYTLPTFEFSTLHHPPFFLRRALPHRLACIRSINLVYDQMKLMKPNTPRTHVGCSTARYWHRVGECTFCNPIHWLDGIKKYMTGLEIVKVYIFLEKKHQMPFMGDAWIARLFDLQIGPNGLRKMKIHLSPKAPQIDSSSSEEGAYTRKVQRLDELLQQRLKKGIENYAATQRAPLPRTVNALPSPITRPPSAHTIAASSIGARTLDIPWDMFAGGGWDDL